MKKTILNLALFFFWCNCFSQVGINTATPSAMLDVTSLDNGILLPRIALTANNVAAPVVNPQGGALEVSTMIYNTATVAGINGVSPGYYYWNGTLWIPFLSPIPNDWKLNGNTATTAPVAPITYGVSTIGSFENFIGTTDANDLVIGTSSIERMRFKKASGNVGIGTATPSNKLHISTSTAGLTTTFSENTFLGDINGIGIIGTSINNPGFGFGGQFFGGSVGIQGTANSTTFSGNSTGVIGNSTGSGGGLATRIGGSFQSSGNNGNNYGGKFSAVGAINNYGADFIANGVATNNYGGNFNVTGGSNGNWAGVFRSTGGGIATGADFIANYGTVVTTAGYFQATGTTTNFGTRVSVSDGAVNYAGYFSANGGTTNTAGYFSATNGASVYDNKAIIVPPNGGLVGIGTLNPVDQLEVAGGYVRSTGYRCRTGTAGVYPGNTFNINWTGTTAQLWIDTFNIGTFQFTSDRRLKENILKMNDTALSRVLQLKPVSYNYKNIPNTIFTGSDVVIEGFIADELQQIIPSAVNGTKDAITTEGTIQPQTINTAPIIAVLTKAIQEQQKTIEKLEARLKIIENNK